MIITSVLIKWYHKNKRHLPWRDTQNPYLIWISEVILQQTRVIQGLDYYLRFIRKLPDIQSLATVSEDEVLKLWQGLGYYTRARNLHAAAKNIVHYFNGKFPDNYTDILKLKGIGKYTAAAVASFAFNEPVPVVDGNVCRVLSRLYAINYPADSAEGQKLIYSLAEKIIDKKNPGIFNQAIMEFGALQCVPQNPDCSKCPLNKKCLAYIYNNVSLFPVKKK